MQETATLAGDGDRRGSTGLLVAVGALHALLFLLAYALLTSTPGARASDEELLAFYAGGDQRRLVLVGLYVMPFAGIAFLWFNAALRARLLAAGRPGTELVGGLQLASGILYVALFFAGAAAASVTAVSVEHSAAELDHMVARLFPQYGATLLLVFGMRMAAMFVFTTSRLGRLAGALPRWFEHVGLVTALFLLLSTGFSRALVLVFPLWLLLLCALIHARARRELRSDRARVPAPPAGRA
jgi:hypothetical protein